MTDEEWKQETRAAVKYGMENQLNDEQIQNVIDYEPDFCLSGSWVHHVDETTVLL